MADINVLDIPDDELDEYIRKLQPTDDVEEEISTEVTDSVAEADEEPEEPLNESDEEVAEEFTTEDQDTDPVTETKEVTTTAELDYKAEYEKLLAPFNANGKAIKVDSVEDAVTLMQMGANYNKKMAEFKPHLKLVKMLQNHGLLDENKLNTLIEISNGNQSAIKKVIADSDIDLYSLDAEEDKKYASANYTVNDSEVELDLVLDELRSSTGFNRTVEVVTNTFDPASKAELLKQPQILKVINRDVESGKYDIVSNEVERLRALGKLPYDISALDAYGRVAQYLDTNPSQVTSTNLSNQVDPHRQVKEEQRNASRKAAAPTRKNVAKPTVVTDILNLSDEEFERMAQQGLFKQV